MYVWATEATLVFIFFCKSTTFQAEYKIIAILFILFKFRIGEVIEAKGSYQFPSIPFLFQVLVNFFRPVCPILWTEGADAQFACRSTVAWTIIDKERILWQQSFVL